jgi:hypothetical protein
MIENRMLVATAIFFMFAGLWLGGILEEYRMSRKPCIPTAITEVEKP